METPTYITKNGAPEVRYICPACQKKHKLEVHGLSYYVAAMCCKCGAVGTFRRLTTAASEKVAGAK